MMSVYRLAMNLYTSPARLASIWRRMIDTGTEAGQTPLLALGVDALQTDSGLSLLALGEVVRRHAGPVDPIIVAGGEGELWLLARMQWQRPSDRGRAMTGAVVYGGNDVATYAATLDIACPPQRTGRLSTGMAWMLTPTAAPGAERSDLEMLPLALAGDAFMPVTSAGPEPDLLERLEDWLVVVVVIGLFLVAWLS